jgi:hypothetical protein
MLWLAAASTDTCDESAPSTSLLQYGMEMKLAQDLGAEAGKERAQKKPSQELLQQHSNATMEMVVKSQRESLRLAKIFAEQAAHMQTSTSKELFKSFRICGQCQNFRRFGEEHDGGYLMCMDGLQDPSQIPAAYSLGVEHHDKWSEDVLTQLNVPVHQFDCTVSSSDCQGCKFYKKCIVSSDGMHNVPGHESEGWTFEQALSETGQGNTQDGSLLMKMDIESSEWAIFAQEKPEVIKKFGQLIVEFHNLGNETRHGEYLQAVKNILAANLKVVHLHGNNYDQNLVTTEDGGSRPRLTIPNVVEVTFASVDSRPNGCSEDQEYNELDRPNLLAPWAPAEAPMAHLR